MEVSFISDELHKQLTFFKKLLLDIAGSIAWNINVHKEGKTQLKATNWKCSVYGKVFLKNYFFFFLLCLLCKNENWLRLILIVVVPESLGKVEGEMAGSGGGSISSRNTKWEPRVILLVAFLWGCHWLIVFLYIPLQKSMFSFK